MESEPIRCEKFQPDGSRCLELVTLKHAKAEWKARDTDPGLKHLVAMHLTVLCPKCGLWIKVASMEKPTA